MIKLRGRLLKNESLARFSSWKVGGPAPSLYLPADTADFIYFIEQLPPQEPLTILGLGSNTLIRDGGVHGTTLITQGTLKKLFLLEPNTLYAEAGVASPSFARFAARLNLSGAEFLAGIPGTIGGALAMNAGCNGQETWDIVSKVETINRQGEKKIRLPNHYKIGYRSVGQFSGEIYLGAHFKLNSGDKAEILNNIRRLLQYRTETQPTSEANCGSVFCNPPGKHAAQLIESCGLKGYKIGGASISTKHANFIINEGKASADDIEKLIKKTIQTVLQVHHIRLIPEVRIIGCPKK